MTSSKQADELLSCPFCGGDKLDEIPVSNTGGHRRFIWCLGCNMEGPWSTLNQTAAERWNRRSHLQPPAEWQWVPKEPDGIMMIACVDANIAHDNGAYEKDKVRRSQRIWKAMLAAAPSSSGDAAELFCLYCGSRAVKSCPNPGCRGKPHAGEAAQVRVIGFDLARPGSDMSTLTVRLENGELMTFYAEPPPSHPTGSDGWVNAGWRYRNIKTGIVTLTDQPPDRALDIADYEVTEVFARNPAKPTAPDGGGL